MNTCNSANSIKLGKLLKRFKLTPINNQRIIKSIQEKQYSGVASNAKVLMKLVGLEAKIKN